MLRMAKKRGRPPIHPEGQKPKRSGKNINVWVNEEIGAAFERYLETTKPTPTNTSAIELAIELLLRQAGQWPTRAEGGGE
jgi:hypothetical protein